MKIGRPKQRGGAFNSLGGQRGGGVTSGSVGKGPTLPRTTAKTTRGMMRATTAAMLPSTTDEMAGPDDTPASGHVGAVLRSARNRSSGRALDTDTRDQMEEKFGKS